MQIAEGQIPVFMGPDQNEAMGKATVTVTERVAKFYIEMSAEDSRRILDMLAGRMLVGLSFMSIPVVQQAVSPIFKKEGE